mgnify:CR=1 FL=1
MLVTCPRCFATYNVPESALSGTGRKVRCSACHFEWTEALPPRDAIAGFAPAPPEPVPAVAAPPSEFASLLSEPAPVAEPVKAPARRGRSRGDKSGAGFGAVAGWSFVILATLACALVLAREPLGRKATWLADMYEMIGLPVETPADWFRFDGVALEKSEADGQTVLLVRGKVINQSRKTREVPQLRLFWRQKNGDIGPETWLQTRPARLPVGEAARFNGELRGVDAAIGGEVKILFVTPHDVKPEAKGTTHAVSDAASAPGPTAKDAHSMPQAHAVGSASPAHEPAASQTEPPVETPASAVSSAEPHVSAPAPTAHESSMPSAQEPSAPPANPDHHDAPAHPSGH